MKYPVEYEIVYQEVVAKLKKQLDECGSYSKLAAHLGGGVSKSYLHQILAKGYRPVGGKHAAFLGIPHVELVPTVICPKCNQVQVGNKCGCTNPKYPKVEKKPVRKRIRIDIEANTDKRTVQAIRDMPIKQRTAILKAAVAIQSVDPNV